MWALEIGLFILLTFLTLLIILLAGYMLSIWIVFCKWLEKISIKFWDTFFEQHHSNKGQ